MSLILILSIELHKKKKIISDAEYNARLNSINLKKKKIWMDYIKPTNYNLYKNGEIVCIIKPGWYFGKFAIIKKTDITNYKKTGIHLCRVITFNNRITNILTNQLLI